MNTDKSKIEEQAIDINPVLSDSFQSIPRFVYDGVVEEKQRSIDELNLQIKENAELKQEIINLNKIIAITRKLASAPLLAIYCWQMLILLLWF